MCGSGDVTLCDIDDDGVRGRVCDVTSDTGSGHVDVYQGERTMQK